MTAAVSACTGAVRTDCCDYCYCQYCTVLHCTVQDAGGDARGRVTSRLNWAHTKSIHPEFICRAPLLNVPRYRHPTSIAHGPSGARVHLAHQGPVDAITHTRPPSLSIYIYIYVSRAIKHSSPILSAVDIRSCFFVLDTRRDGDQKNKHRTVCVFKTRLAGWLAGWPRLSV